MHLWGCKGQDCKNLLVVLSSNKFQIICPKNKMPGKDQSLGRDKKTNQTNSALNPENGKNYLWKEAKSKVFDFSQVKGDFVNMIELE